MKISVHLIRLSFVLCLLMGCTASPNPTTAATAVPSPEPKLTSMIAPTEVSNVSLIAGQWNYLFYHPELKQVVLVNGGPNRGKPKNDPLELWAWDGAQWTLISADPQGQGPAWRNFAGAAFDTRRNMLVIHGGVQDANSRMEDTWEWDGQTWTQFKVPGPGFREGAAMAYDEARGQTILFGGANEKFEILGDTWAWDGARWTQVSTTGPAPRFPSAIVYDSAREKVLLFSGHFVGPNDFINFSDFWEWDGTAWHEIIVEGEKPDVRNIAQVVFDPVNKNVLLFGGGEETFLSDMWSWDGMKWTQISKSGALARSGLGGAYDLQRDRLVVFGGVAEAGGTAITDTWEWDGQNWMCVHGCK
jgi:hypothetical protein